LNILVSAMVHDFRRCVLDVPERETLLIMLTMNPFVVSLSPEHNGAPVP
jgi:hypothetical protein